MRVLCFGASLTAQIGAGGYVGQLVKKNINLDCAGYGGYQLEHAHLVVKDIAKFKHIDTVLVEWFSPIKIYSNDELDLYLGTLLHKLQKAFENAKILCVMIPNRNSAPHKQYFAQLERYFTTRAFPYLNLESVDVQPGDLKEDGLHSLEKGAEKYAKKIIEHLADIKPLPLFTCPETYMEVKELKKTVIAEIGEEIQIKSLSGESNVIGVSLVVGPRSGIILKNGVAINLWDKWSGRDRECIKYNFFTPCNFKPTDTEFDRSSSALQPKWGPTNMEIRNIYYVGSDIEVTLVKSKKYLEL